MLDVGYQYGAFRHNISRSNIKSAVSDIISDVFEMILDIQYRTQRATCDIGILSHVAPHKYVLAQLGQYFTTKDRFVTSLGSSVKITKLLYL